MLFLGYEVFHLPLCYVDKDRRYLKFSGAHQNYWVLKPESANNGRIVNEHLWIMNNTVSQL